MWESMFLVRSPGLFLVSLTFGSGWIYFDNNPIKMTPSSREYRGCCTTNDGHDQELVEISLACHSCVGWALVGPAALLFEVQLCIMSSFILRSLHMDTCQLCEKCEPHSLLALSLFTRMYKKHTRCSEHDSSYSKWLTLTWTHYFVPHYFKVICKQSQYLISIAQRRSNELPHPNKRHPLPSP